MIEMTIAADGVNVVIPSNMLADAPQVLQPIWCEEFAGRCRFGMRRDKKTDAFLEYAKTAPGIMVWV